MKFSAWMFICSLVCLLCTAAPATATTYARVGSDSACDYSTISQAVLNAPGTDNLFIFFAKNATVSGPALIFGRDVTVNGGYDNCSDNFPSGRTVIDASGFTGSALWMSGGYGGTANYKVKLASLEIKNGRGSSGVRGGAITIDGPFHVTLVDAYLHDNSTNTDGGAIYVKGQPGVSNGVGDRTSLTVQDDSIISGNSATHGGGIACQDRVLVFSHHSQIGANVASARGGGIESENCFVFLGSHGPLQGVGLNKTTDSNGRGGGIYAHGGTVLISASRTERSQVWNNQADVGGGIDIEGAKLFAYDTDIINNTANSRGGGIYAVNSNVVMGRLKAGANCHTAVRCSNLSGNRVLGSTGSAAGGGLYAISGKTLISGTFVEGNSAATGAGLAIFVIDALGSNNGFDLNGLQIYASVVADNGAAGSYSDPDASVVTAQGSASVILYNTFVRNASVPQVVYTPSFGSNGYAVVISGSIFANSTGFASSPGVDGQYADGACNDLGLSTSSNWFSQHSSASTHGGYVFVDAANEDYRLAPNSSDLDYCNIELPAYVVSADGGPRPYDDPGIQQLYGNYDLGGLERHPDDLIFRNGLD